MLFLKILLLNMFSLMCIFLMFFLYLVRVKIQVPYVEDNKYKKLVYLPFIGDEIFCYLFLKEKSKTIPSFFLRTPELFLVLIILLMLNILTNNFILLLYLTIALCILIAIVHFEMFYTYYDERKSVLYTLIFVLCPLTIYFFYMMLYFKQEEINKNKETNNEILEDEVVADEIIENTIEEELEEVLISDTEELDLEN